jgi:hypothetical protein
MAGLKSSAPSKISGRKPLRLGSSPGLAQVGTTEHAVVVLVVVELLALVAIRRYFKSAHGG